MAVVNENELLDLARDKFRIGEFAVAERLLQQLILLNNKIPEVYQMLGTIYYDQGKFSRAIQTFKRALEIDPTYTDASVGLSIIYNDLGKYDEGKKVFEDARSILNEKKTKTDPFVEDRLAAKHLETGDLYFQYSRYDDALDQYLKASQLSSRKPEVMMKVAEVYLKKGQHQKALKELRKIVETYPSFVPARLRLGVVYYNSSKVVEALHEWEDILLRDPTNKEALSYLKMAQDVGITSI